MMKESKKSNLGFVVLAAGRGKRMCSDEPKVLMKIGGQPLIVHVLKALEGARRDAEVAIVVGFKASEIESAVRAYIKESRSDLSVSFILQSEPLGTGDAVGSVIRDEAWMGRFGPQAHLLILPGDQPLMTAELISQMLDPVSRTVAIRMMTCFVDSPSGYGRVKRRGKKGQVLKIVEEKDATHREKEIKEIATSVFLFRVNFLKAGLSKLSNKNAQKEYYLTDLIFQAARGGKKIDVVQWDQSTDLTGVNNPWELARAGKILNQRCLNHWALKGVHFQDPDNTWIEETVVFRGPCEVEPGVILKGRCVIESGVVLQSAIRLEDVSVGKETVIRQGTVAIESNIGASCWIGPYAHLRPGSSVEDRVKIGNYVELKNTRIASGTSVAHLSYLGDAEVGRDVNIGCGFVTCNFDGRTVNGTRKHKTVIEDRVFMGSDCQVVAPIRIGAGAYIASGSTITRDVGEGALGIARSRQENKEGFAARFLRRQDHEDQREREMERPCAE